jgi:hypothetical protein
LSRGISRSRNKQIVDYSISMDTNESKFGEAI